MQTTRDRRIRRSCTRAATPLKLRANGEDLVAACQQCHGPTVTAFDFPLQDYNGDGVIQGVQTEVQSLLNQLSTLLPNTQWRGGWPGKNALATVRPGRHRSWKRTYNWQFVNNDGSLGIHNTAYAVGLLKASIANLTGDSMPDGLPDAWADQLFRLTQQSERRAQCHQQHQRRSQLDDVCLGP